MGKSYSPLSEMEESIATILVDCAYRLHKDLGPGLLEKVYEICLAHLLESNDLKVERQVIAPINYNGIKFEEGFRIDLLIENLVVCEVKSLEQINPVWYAQVLTQLKLTEKRLGFLINFNVPIIKNGINRIIF